MLALEMGGNNPLVVWDVKDIDAAVHHAVMSAFISAGQRCTCARRLIVQDTPKARPSSSAWSKWPAKLPSAPRTPSRSRSWARWSRAPSPRAWCRRRPMMVAKGGKVLLQMRQLDPNAGFVTAGIVDVTDAKGIPDEEWFGPLLQIVRVQGLRQRHQGRQRHRIRPGRRAAVADEELWKRFASRPSAGIVNWNRPTTGAASSAPFGGVGKSGNHRPSAYYAADYCAYPVASIETSELEMPAKLSPGLKRFLRNA
jgi:succinylglutamic semialdehyde dehydrogenase